MREIKKIVLILIVIFISACSSSQKGNGNDSLFGYDNEGYNLAGFNYEGINRDTGTEFDKEGYNVKGYNSNGINREGYDIEGYHKKWSIYFSKAEFMEFGDRKKIALKSGSLILGMTKTEVLATIGEPKNILQEKNTEIWQYDNYALKFENEMLIHTS